MAGLASRCAAAWATSASGRPTSRSSVVVCSPAAFDGLALDERERAIAALQSATLDGGVHLVRTILAERDGVSVDELRSRYAGWAISVEGDGASGPTFLAHKQAALH